MASQRKKGKGTILLTLKKPSEVAQIPNTDQIRFFTGDGQVDSNAKQQIKILPTGEIQILLTVSEMAPKDRTNLPGVVTFRGDLFLNLEIAPSY
ncbi:MAG: hypothetical protein HC767_00310 [Akkermansiaceae bacterium]|nr:hypothetical protein [Akkermansiaceae bacterium]